MKDMSLCWVNGTFDVIHSEHIRLLKYAKSLAEILIVGIDSDERVKSKKGSTRPINSVEDRKTVLESIKYVDMVVTFDSDQDLSDLIKRNGPDYWVMSGEYESAVIPGKDYAKKIVLFDFIKGYSSTNIIKKINE